MIYQRRVKILDNQQIGRGYLKMRLDAKQIARHASPGQFIHIRVKDATEPLLRRPISIHKANPNLEILYEVVGRGSSALSQRKKGEMLDIIGPLGNGFKITSNSQLSILVAGGMGVAPLVFLAQKLKKFIVLIGARSKDKIMCVEEFKQLGGKVEIITEDGSLGQKGLVTDLLLNIVHRREMGFGSSNYCHPRESGDPEKIPVLDSCFRRNDTFNSGNLDKSSTIYACGPKPMLAEIAKIGKEFAVPAQVSLEEFMGCGIGACLGCAIKTNSGYKRVCKDGPVFDAREIIW